MRIFQPFRMMGVQIFLVCLGRDGVRRIGLQRVLGGSDLRLQPALNHSITLLQRPQPGTYKPTGGRIQAAGDLRVDVTHLLRVAG